MFITSMVATRLLYGPRVIPMKALCAHPEQHKSVAAFIWEVPEELLLGALLYCEAMKTCKGQGIASIRAPLHPWRVPCHHRIATVKQSTLQPWLMKTLDPYSNTAYDEVSRPALRTQPVPAVLDTLLLAASRALHLEAHVWPVAHKQGLTAVAVSWQPRPGRAHEWLSDTLHGLGTLSVSVCTCIYIYMYTHIFPFETVVNI